MCRSRSSTGRRRSASDNMLSGRRRYRKPALRQVPPDIAEARGLQPEIPVLEAGAHPLVEAQAAVHELAPHQAAGVAVVLGQQHEQREVAAGGEVLRPADLVDIGIEPAHLRRRRLQRREGAAQEARMQAVVGVEAEQRPQPRESRERERDAGVARGRQPAIRPPQREDAARDARRPWRARCARSRDRGSHHRPPPRRRAARLPAPARSGSLPPAGRAGDGRG